MVVNVVVQQRFMTGSIRMKTSTFKGPCRRKLVIPPEINKCSVHFSAAALSTMPCMCVCVCVCGDGSSVCVTCV